MTISTNPAPLLVSAREAAHLLGISQRSLWTRTNTQEIPSIRIGASVRYAVSDLENYIDERRVGRRCPQAGDDESSSDQRKPGGSAK